MALHAVRSTTFPMLHRIRPGPWTLLFAAALVVRAQEQAPSTPPGAPATNTPAFPTTMVVTGTRTARGILETPVRTEVVTAQDMAITGSPKLADVLEYQTGLRVESNCQNCNTTEIRMLGLQQRYISMLTDGMATFSGLAGVYGIEQIPMALIDRIEVVKGGASALYGPSAVAGVVNIIPRDPTHTHATMNFSYNWMEGSVSGNRPNTDANGVFEWANKGGTVGFTAYGIQSFVQGLDVNGDDFTEVARRDLLGGGIRAVFKPTPAVKLSMDYLHTHEDRRGGEDDEGLGIRANEALLNEELKSTRDVGSILLKHTPSEKFDYQLGFSAANTTRDSYYGGIAPLGYAPPGSAGHDPAVAARLSTRFPQYAGAFADPNGPFYNPDWTEELGFGVTDNLLTMTDVSANTYLNERHTLTYGFQFRYETIVDASGLGRVVDDSYLNHGGFIQHDWKLADPLELIYGLRMDKHSLVDAVIASPRVALKWSPRPDFDLRLAVATGFRAPELFDEDLHISNVGGALEVVSLSPDLREESAITYSVAPQWRLNQNWQLEGNLFLTRISDVFFNDQSSDDPSTSGVIESTKINAGDAAVYGVEMNLVYQNGWFSAEIGYVEQRSRYGDAQLAIGMDGDPVNNPIFVRDFERTPNRYGVIKFIYDTGVWSLFAAGKLTGPMEVPHVVSDELSGELIGNALRESSYFLIVDLGASYTWRLPGHTLVTAQIGIRNLFNDYQDDLDRGPFRDSAYVYGPRFPRTVHAGLKVEF